MIDSITAYFDSLERDILQSDAVPGYVVLQRETTSIDGKLRVRAQVKDGGLLELFEYVTLGMGRQISRLRYSYHWQNAAGALIKRWDNVNHHLHLPNAPHHVHLPDGSVVGIADPPDVVKLLAEIETHHEGGLP